MNHLLESQRPAAAAARWQHRTELFGVEIDVARMTDAIELLQQWLSSDVELCQYVVTPNVDHVVLLQHREDLRTAYHYAGLVLADGWPVVAASRFLGRSLPERVAGSDLVPRFFSALADDQQLRVFLLGAAPGVAERAAENVHQRWPNVEVVGTYSPPLGFERDADECDHILDLIRAADPELLVVGLGAPKQELWVQRFQERIHAKAALCVGATIDFLAGERRRAPIWMRRAGLEWLHRLLSEPRRLARRYAQDAVIFPRIVARQWWRQKHSR